MGKAKKPPEGDTVAANKKARRDYEIVSSAEAGISLLGSEVKSIRQGNASLKESYIREKNGELYLVGCHISPYSHSPVDAHEPTRQRKLLLHRQEIDRLIVQIARKGLTLVPLRLYFNKDGRCKLEIALGRGKKLFDKREDEKKRVATREVERMLKRN